MAVDAQRGDFHINRITPQEMGLLMSAQSYRPEVTEALNRISLFPKLEPLKNISLNTISPGPHPVYTQSGYPCLKTRNVSGILADREPSGFADVSGIKELSKVQVANEDLLVNLTGAGSIGRVSIYFGENKPITNQHIARISISELADPAYVCAFLRTWWGERVLEQGIAGSTGQLNMVNDHVRSIPIPLLAEAAQQYIGNKVRQAETLRAWAKELEELSDTRIRDRFKYKPVVSMRSHPRKVSKILLSSISLNPEFAEGTGGQNTFENAVLLSSLIETCKCGDPVKSEDRTIGEYPYYGASGPIDQHDEYNFDGTYLIVAQDGSIGIASVVRGKFWANNHVWVVEIKADYDIDAIARFLNNHFPYWKGVATGSVVPKVTADNLLMVKVPLDIASDFTAGNMLLNANLGKELSNKSTTAAKLLVEALIEGKITEQDLVTAQQSLEKGDPSLDQKILCRLTSTGIDNGGDPLFPDLDQLFQLLEQATNSGSEV